MVFAIVPSVLIAGKRFLKLAETNQANRKIRKCDSDSFAISVFDYAIVGAAVASQGLSEAILAIEDVPNIDFETRQPEVIAKLSKNCARTFAS